MRRGNHGGERADARMDKAVVGDMGKSAKAAYLFLSDDEVQNIGGMRTAQALDGAAHLAVAENRAGVVP